MLSESISSRSSKNESAPAPVPASPGFRVPPHSVLATEHLKSDIESEKIKSYVPGFMRNRKTVPKSPAVVQGSTSGIAYAVDLMITSAYILYHSVPKSKSKKSTKPMPANSEKLGLGGSRRQPPKSTEERELEKLECEMRATTALREKNKALVMQAVLKILA